MKVSILKQTILQKLSRNKETDSPDPEYHPTRKQVHSYDKLSSQYAKVLKSWARKSEQASKNQHEMGEIMMEAADDEENARTKELLTRMGDCLLTVSDVQHSMLVRSVEAIIFPFQQFQQETKELNTMHKYWKKTMAAYKAQLEMCQKLQRNGASPAGGNTDKYQLALDELSEKAKEMDDAFHESRERAYKLKHVAETENTMVQMFDMLHNYFKTGLEYTQEVMPIVEEYKQTMKKKKETAPDKLDRITTPLPEGASASSRISSTSSVRQSSAPPSSALPPTPGRSEMPSLPPTPASLRQSAAPPKLPSIPTAVSRSSTSTASNRQSNRKSMQPMAIQKVHPIGYATVEYDYEAQESTEISLAEGEFVFVYEKDEEGWGTGRTLEEARIGEFPWNYVSNFTAAQRARAEYDYEAQEEGELSIKEGSEITVLIQEGDWWIGELGGKIGCFPQNYCQLI